jgi:Xaa-Pro aminopeptidase
MMKSQDVWRQWWGARITRFLLYVVMSGVAVNVFAANIPELKNRRERAVAILGNGVLLLHSRSNIEMTADAFRQDPYFYYFTGLANTADSIFLIEGKSGESWLFIPVTAAWGKVSLSEVRPGQDVEKQLGIDHVVPLSDLRGFLSERIKKRTKLFYPSSSFDIDTLAYSLKEAQEKTVPAWVALVAQQSSLLQPHVATHQLDTLMAVQSPSELISVRAAARSTVPAVLDAMHVVRPGIRPRSVSLRAVNACWKGGAHGPSFWPFIVSGTNGVLPEGLSFFTQYDQFDAPLKSGDLVRLDIGCEWNHYGGDLGRTVPVSGHYTDQQRELWNDYIAAYRAGLRVLRAGITAEIVFEAWRTELLSHKASAKYDLTRQAIDAWSSRENSPLWEVHTMNLQAGHVDRFEAGTTVDYEPNVAFHEQGYYLEDMYLLTTNGAELLTPGLPYTAEEIEQVMQKSRPD